MKHYLNGDFQVVYDDIANLWKLELDSEAMESIVVEGDSPEAAFEVAAGQIRDVVEKGA